MAAPKGHTKYGGRARGVPNKKTIEQKERIDRVISLLEETLHEDIAKLKPQERAKMWQELQEYRHPKLARTELTGQDGKKLDLTIHHVGVKGK